MVRDANGYTPLLKAASLGRLKMVKTLVEKASVDPRHIDPHGHTPREKALLYSKNDVVNYSYKATWNDGSTTMESKSLKLGKKGYLDSSYVVVVDNKADLKSIADASAEFAEFVSFDSNYKHKIRLLMLVERLLKHAKNLK